MASSGYLQPATLGRSFWHSNWKPNEPCTPCRYFCSGTRRRPLSRTDAPRSTSYQACPTKHHAAPMHETEWVIPHPASRIPHRPRTCRREAVAREIERVGQHVRRRVGCFTVQLLYGRSAGHPDRCRAMLVGTCLELNGSRSPVVRSWCDEMSKEKRPVGSVDAARLQ